MKIRYFKKIVCFMAVFTALLMGPARMHESHAGVAVAPSVCSNCPYGSPVCVMAGTTEISTAAILQAIKQYMEDMIADFTEWFKNAWDNMIKALLEAMNEFLEGYFMQWQDNLWAYDWRPAMQNMMGQLNTAFVDQSRSEASFVDAEIQQDFQKKFQDIQNDAHRAARPSDSICSAGTVTGGFPRANAFSRAMRKASERDTGAGLTNKVGSAYESGPIEALSYQWQRYCNFLVHPDNNGGDTGCGATVVSPVATRNADVEPIRFLYNTYTLNIVDPGVPEALEALKENLVNIKPPSVVPPEALESNTGREALLANREYTARKLAARSTIEHVAASRMPIVTPSPGDLNDYVEAIKVAAGTPLAALPDKFSYRDIMHTMSVEKFTSGQYNLDQVGEIENVERESLVLSVFHLMQLREKFELMERGVMALAVQTSIELDREIDSTGSSGEAISN